MLLHLSLILKTMSLFFYNIFLFFFRLGTGIASLFNPKAKKWVAGRKHIFRRLQEAIPGSEKIVWVHCASLGEFEQGRPVMEALKQQYPEYKILLSFFSPSGYEVQKNWAGADWVFYLPVDGPRNAKRFLEIVQPALVIFVKYEFWYYYLKKISYRKIPVLLISALFRSDMSFFKWYGGLQRKMLSRFDRLFVQNASSKKLLDGIGLAPITAISGDTRFDRVLGIAGNFEPVPGIEEFIGGGKAIVAGSTWHEDEKVLARTMTLLDDPNLKLIIAPHEISEHHIHELQNQFPGAIRYSQLTDPGQSGTTGIRHPVPGTRPPSPPCLIIDNVGLLARLYRYAFITYVGGGFRSMGVHNVLEAAVHDKPVLIGPFYKKYSEAVELVNAGGALVVQHEMEMADTVNALLANRHGLYEQSAKAAGGNVRHHAGATKIITGYIQEKRLLTS